MLNGSNIPIVVQKDNQTETFNNKQDKTVLKCNEPSSQSLSKSDSNILMAFPLRLFCCCFLFREIKPSLNSVLLLSYQCWGPTWQKKIPKAPLLPLIISSLCFPHQSTVCWMPHSLHAYRLSNLILLHCSPLLPSPKHTGLFSVLWTSQGPSYYRAFAI